MLTIYTVVREFEGEFDRIQRNAIRSWMALEPRPQVILFGKGEPGAAEAARDLGVPLRQVRRNKWGTPLLRNAMIRVHKMAEHSIHCYVNADIVILQDFMFALAKTMARFPRFLMSARRWDFDPSFTFTGTWNPFTGTYDSGVLHQWVRWGGALHRPTGVDVFCYRGVSWSQIPDLAVGRSAYDNWLVGRAVTQGVPFVDVTDVATVIHQTHPRRPADDDFTNDPERLLNQRLTRESLGTRYQYGFDVACWRLTEHGEFELTRFGKSRRWHRR